MKKGILSLILFTFLSSLSLAFNFSVAPTRFELKLDKINTNEVILINNTSQPMRLESYLEAPKGYEKYNLNNDIKLYPKMVAIKPGGKQTVRFRVKPSSGMKPGEYKSYIVFKEVPVKSEVKQSTDKVDVQIKMITEVGISVYGYYGDVVYKAKIDDVKFKYLSKTKTLETIVTAETLGNSSVKLTRVLEVLSSSGKVEDKIETQLGRTPRTGRGTIEDRLTIENLRGKRVRITIYDPDKKEIYKKTSQVL